MNILATVSLPGAVQAVEVARVLCLEKSALSRNLKIMEDNGWIQSRPGEAGNTRVLTLTRQGEQLLERAAPAWRKAQVQVLGERTAAALCTAADRLRNTTAV